MLMKPYSRLRRYIREVISLKTSPHEIALGFAVGTFITVIPSPGFNILLGMLFIFIYRRVSKLSLFLSFAFWNPLVLVPTYYAAFRLGNLILGKAPVVAYEVVLMNQAYHFTVRLFLGSIILSTVFSIGSYYLIRHAAERYQSTRTRKPRS
jgi:hypothetical protein